MVAVAAAALAAIGFLIYAGMRHAEAVRLEQALAHAKGLQEYAETMRDRAKEAASRYNHLLRTGDTRIETYFHDIYMRAAEERHSAELLRKEAANDRAASATVEARIYSIAERLVHDHVKWSATKLRSDPENYQRRKFELEKAFDFVEAVGYRIPASLRQDSLARLKDAYSAVVREQALRDEQRRINQQMREDERIRREREAAIREAEAREREIQNRLNWSLREHQDVHNAEVEELRRLLAEAQASAERAKSMAQITKAGHVYILSNIGSFGTDVYKVGMTRHLEPHDRMRELGDASVPFPFDVHAMISCDNAPALENALHRELTRYRVNRINLRKEYFRVSLATILEYVKKHHGVVEYVAEPVALEYRDTQTISIDSLLEIESEFAELGVNLTEDEE
jgi:hypothetical protein